MDIRAKVPSIILIILVLIFLTSTAAGFYLYQQEHRKNIELEEKIEELGVKQKIAEAKYLEAQKVLSSLEEKLKESSKQVEDLNNALALEKKNREDAFAEFEQARRDLEDGKNIMQELEDKLAKAEEKAKQAQDKMDALNNEKKELENKLKELENPSQGVELGKIVVAPDASGDNKAKAVLTQKQEAKISPEKEGSALEGKVLVVNKEYNFVVINLGSKDGVSLGDMFTLVRGKSSIGDIKVEKLHDSMSAAGFISEDLKNKVREGDKVVKKAK